MATESSTRRTGASTRRIEQFKSNWKIFASSRTGLIGLGLLTVVIVIALCVPLIFPAEMLDVTQVTSAPNLAPNAQHWLGTDTSGRDELALLAWGARISLTVGFTATLMSMVIGTSVGMLAGHLRGGAQWVMLRVIDFFLVIPSLVLAMVLSAVLMRGVFTIIIAIGVTSWAGTSRVVRSQTMTIEARPYIERSRALGASGEQILGWHVLPAVMPLVMANTTLQVGSAIIAESTLSFLGLGDASVISWGSMLKRASDLGAATAGFWWQVLPPGIAIVVVVMCFTLVGRVLESVINPTLRSR